VESLNNLLAMNLKTFTEEMKETYSISDELRKLLATVATQFKLVENLFPSQSAINEMLESAGLGPQSYAATVKRLTEMAKSFNLSALQKADWERLSSPIGDNYFLGTGWQRRASDPIPAKQKSPIGFGHPNHESAD